MNSSLPAPTKSQATTMSQLVDEIGCAVCLFIHGVEGSEGEIHHLKEGNKRISHDHVIPLCVIHHRHGIPGHPSRHSGGGGHGGPYEFKQAYGVDDFDLLERCEAYIDRAYSSEDDG